MLIRIVDRMNYLTLHESPDSHDNIIDLEDHSDYLSCKSQGTLGHQCWLDHILILYIRVDCAFLDADTCEFFTLAVSVSEFSHDHNWIQPYIKCYLPAF